MTEVRWQRPKLYPKQEAALFHPVRFGIVEGSTKSGKTLAAMAWLVEQALETGGICWWVAPTFPVSNIAYRRLKHMLPRSAYKANDTAHTLALVGGSTLWFKSADRPDTLYGEDVAALVLDEASRMTVDAWIATKSTLTATAGKARLVGNVKGRTWHYRQAREAERGLAEWRYDRLTWQDSVDAGIVTQDTIEEARRTLPQSIFEMLFDARMPSEGVAFFPTERIQPVTTAPDGGHLCRAWDLSTGTARGDFTVGAKLHRDGDRVTVLDLVRGKWPPEVVLDRIAATAHADGPGVDVVLEQEKGSAGKLLNESIRRRLAEAGWKGKLHSNPITGDKMTRAFGLAGCIGAGNFQLLEAAWDDQVYVELDSFPSEEHDDIVDALSLGFNHLDANPRKRLTATYHSPQSIDGRIGGGIDPNLTYQGFRT